MCFGSQEDVDPTQPPMRVTKQFFNQKVVDPTQQPFKITQSEDNAPSETQEQKNTRRNHSYKGRGAFIDVTDREFKSVARRPSDMDPGVAVPKPKRNLISAPNTSWRRQSSHVGIF